MEKDAAVRQLQLRQIVSMHDFLVGARAEHLCDAIGLQPLDAFDVGRRVVGQSPSQFVPLAVADRDDVAFVKDTIRRGDADRQ